MQQSLQFSSTRVPCQRPHAPRALAPVAKVNPARVTRRHRPDVIRLAATDNGTVPTAVAVDAAQGTEESLLELDQGNFYEYLAQQGDTVVVVDFYTAWCGPCKVIYPELVKLAKERPDVRIVKFNCNKQNKELGMKLGIKVAPTFHVYKNSEKVSEMTGAKLEQLVALIDKAVEA